MPHDAAQAAAAARYLARCYSASAAEYEALWAPVLRPFGEHLIETLAAAVHLPSRARVLDLGAGTGALSPMLARQLANATLLAADPAPGMLRVARVQHSVRLAVAMDATALGFKSESLDVVILAFVVFHIPDGLAALREVRRVLHPAGTVAVCTWGADAPLPGAEIWEAELTAAGAPPDARPGCLQQAASLDSEDKLRTLLLLAGLRPVRLWTRRFARQWTPSGLLALGSRYGLPCRRLDRLAPDVAAATCDRVGRGLARLAPDALLYKPEIVYAIAARG